MGTLLIIILIIAGLIIGVVVGIWAVKFVNKIVNKKLEQNMVNVILGKRANKMELNGRMIDVHRFIIRDEKDKDVMIDISVPDKKSEEMPVPIPDDKVVKKVSKKLNKKVVKK